MICTKATSLAKQVTKGQNVGVGHLTRRNLIFVIDLIWGQNRLWGQNHIWGRILFGGQVHIWGAESYLGVLGQYLGSVDSELRPDYATLRDIKLSVSVIVPLSCK